MWPQAVSSIDKGLCDTRQNAASAVRPRRPSPHATRLCGERRDRAGQAGYDDAQVSQSVTRHAAQLTTPRSGLTPTTSTLTSRSHMRVAGA